MIDEIRQAAAEPASAGTDTRTKELVDEIVRLSTKWGILTEYTAFLATETTVAGVPVASSPMRPEDAAPAARRDLMERSKARGGAGGGNQEQNLGQMKASEKLNSRNGYYDADMKQVETTAIRQIADQTVYKRGDRWVDPNMLDKETDQPDQTVEFGSDEFAAILDKLSATNRQGILALGGEIYILLDGQKILVKAQEAK